MKERIIIAIASILIVSNCLVFYKCGEKAKLTEIKSRALELETKKYYSLQELEIVIFGEIQE
tara:strand:- start:354 stop:539 length:186 start_codon:yes stop_codon:yes gene_type:complete